MAFMSGADPEDDQSRFLEQLWIEPLLPRARLRESIRRSRGLVSTQRTNSSSWRNPPSISIFTTTARYGPISLRPLVSSAVTLRSSRRVPESMYWTHSFELVTLGIRSWNRATCLRSRSTCTASASRDRSCWTSRTVVSISSIAGLENPTYQAPTRSTVRIARSFNGLWTSSMSRALSPEGFAWVVSSIVGGTSGLAGSESAPNQKCLMDDG